MAITHIEAITEQVAELNRLLGLDPTIDFGRTAITFGYIGNVDAGGGNDTRSWSVFLPHPGRVGTHEDSIGAMTTEELAEGSPNVRAVRRELATAIKVLRMAATVAR